jgi:endogenous inhibitor of DNA gyrase (YacG/DUF329 family)
MRWQRKPPTPEALLTKSIRDYSPQIKTLEAIHTRRNALTPIVDCSYCGKPFKRSKCAIRERNYCSKECSNLGKGPFISKSTKGKIISEAQKDKLRQYSGEKSAAWKGGKPSCKVCGKEINHGSQYCLSHKHLLWTQEKWDAAHNGVREKLTGKMPKNTSTPGKFGNITRGWYEVNGIKMFFRSKWEVNYAFYLNFLVRQKQIKKWEYEADVFVFEKIQFGTRSYRPDFKVTRIDGEIEYHEVKGWMTPKSKTQIKRMGIYFPEVNLIVVSRKEYGVICKQVGKMLGCI